MATATCDNCAPHMLPVSNPALQVPLRAFYPLHRRHRQGDYETWHASLPPRRPRGLHT
jgi:hypothetical protein